MDDIGADEITRLLARMKRGEQEAMARVMPLVYGELHRIADQQMRHERADHTLQPTALIHEAYLRLTDREGAPWLDRRHFFRAAAVVMRSILVSHARKHRRQKRRGSHRQVEFDESLLPLEDRVVDLLALDDALHRLEELQPRACSVVELRFFAGLNAAEAAEMLGVSERTVDGDWRFARAWLRKELEAS